MLIDFDTADLRILRRAVHEPMTAAMLATTAISAGLGLNSANKQRKAGEQQAREMRAVQDQQAAAVAGETAKLTEINAAQRRLRRGGRGLLTFADDGTGTVLGQGAA